MPALDGLRAWLESSAILDEAHFKELECYAVKHIANFRTVTAFVESTLDHYFQVCFELPDDLEDGVNVDIEIDGVLCAELYRDAKDWTHRCSGTLIEAATERPFQFQEAVLVENDDERAVKDEYIVRNAGSIKVTSYKAKILACKPVQDDQILKHEHTEKIYSEQAKKAMSHSVSFGEARTIPTMEFCHSETSDPDSAACATFIFYYRSRALLEANGYIKERETLPNDTQGNVQAATIEDENRANEIHEENLPDLWPSMGRSSNPTTTTTARKDPEPSPSSPKTTTASTPASDSGEKSTPTSDLASVSTSATISSASSSSLPSSTTSASLNILRSSLTSPTSASATSRDASKTFNIANGSSGTAPGAPENRINEINNPRREDEPPAPTSSPAPSEAGPSKKRKRKEVKPEFEEEDELPDEDESTTRPQTKIKMEKQAVNTGRSSSPSISGNDLSRRSESAQSAQDEIERLSAENKRLMEQLEAMETKPVLRIAKTAGRFIDLSNDDDD